MVRAVTHAYHSSSGGLVRPHLAATVYVVLLGTSAGAFATGWSALMKNSPMEDFTEQDLSEYFDVLYAALNAPMPVAPVEWHRDSTGAGARIEVLGLRKLPNFDDCRRMRTSLYSKKRESLTRTWTACRGADESWRLVSAD
jgi:surface antigen